MPRPVSARSPDLRQGMQKACAVNDRLNQLVLLVQPGQRRSSPIAGGTQFCLC